MIQYPASIVFLVLAFLAAPAVRACGSLTAEHAWVREPPPVARVAAGYVELANPGSEPVTVERVTGECCEGVMMHDTVNEDGRVRMSHLHALTIEPGGSAHFEPGGRHLMLMSPREPLTGGNEVDLTFHCSDGGSVDFAFGIVRQH